MCVCAVSYTHLDVYKRQGQENETYLLCQSSRYIKIGDHVIPIPDVDRTNPDFGNIVEYFEITNMITKNVSIVDRNSTCEKFLTPE